MNVDLGLQGAAVLLIPAFVFGVLVQAVLGKGAPRWLWLVAALAWSAGALYASEVLFGAETTEENLQPLIDGLLLDEALLGGLIAGTASVVVTWLVARQRPGKGHPAS